MVKRQKKILVVDDDRAIPVFVEGLLPKTEYQIIPSNDGLDVLEQVAKNPPDLIILDIFMPKINGYEICSNIKFDKRFKHIPIIIMTACNQELDTRIGDLMGISYVQKPIDSKVLLEEIQKMVK